MDLLGCFLSLYAICVLMELPENGSNPHMTPVTLSSIGGHAISSSGNYWQQAEPQDPVDYK